MQREVWSKTCRYQVSSDVRMVVITLTIHIPSHMTRAGHRGLVSYVGQPTTCYGCGETVHFNQVCPKRRRVGLAKTKEPTVSWADIAVSGIRNPRTGGEEEEEADRQSIQMGYGDQHQAEDDDAMQEGNTHSTDVASERGEEPEWCTVGVSVVRNDAKSPCVERRQCVEDSVGCEEEILGDTKATP